METIQKSFKQQLKTNAYWSLLKVLGSLVLPIILLILPANYFDEGQSVCLSLLLANTECYGCGMTRAIMHLIHLNLNQALYFNKLSLAVLPLLIVVWAKYFFKESWHLYFLQR
jgi:hypothetical protein